ncbi:uncharacterized protein [Drosophila kikkawai]|uniref:Uncharacterized protein n=1 Tax=Drosophila kikkawai TaxID=30033 RepID=A0A6P4IDU7_DROKI|nr:uncharacterized protein LOC108078049 [Drosophila kikkawai]XP_017027102.1 uncharacterized protein LOC108078049 [Drosophila kikkawai]KAH8314519.1 hypothetical protein KR059_011516 [Drosophila kikkawai]
MGNKLRRRRVDAEEPEGSQPKKPPGRWPFWRIVYWMFILLLMIGLVVAMYFTLKSDFGECSAYDVRCE